MRPDPTCSIVSAANAQDAFRRVDFSGATFPYLLMQKRA